MPSSVSSDALITPMTCPYFNDEQPGMSIRFTYQFAEDKGRVLGGKSVFGICIQAIILRIHLASP